MTLGLIEAEAVGQALRKSRRQLLVGHVLRYHPAISQLEQLVRAGMFGTLRHFSSQRLGRPAPGTRLTAWWELGPHDVSLARAFFAADPTFISTKSSGPQKVKAHLLFPQGKTAELLVGTGDNGTGDNGRVRRIILRGTDAIARFDDRDSTSRARIHQLVPSGEVAADVEEQTTVRQLSHDAAQDALGLELHHFAEAVSHNAPVLTNFEEGARVVAILEAGARSLANAGEWTRIEFKSDSCPVTKRAQVT